MPAYLGDTVEEARARAARAGTTVKVVCVDGKMQTITFETVPGRITLSVEGGRVVEANEE